MTKTPKIYYVNWVLPPYRAMTIPPIGIFIKKKYKGNENILNHDLVHWKQYQRIGLLKFYFQYFKEFLTKGYDQMPMEMEARYEEDEYTKNHYSETYHQ
jgi:hypothetical protein